MNINELQAGRELDVLVAEKVILNRYTDMLPFYSTDIAAAWEVVEALEQRGIVPCINLEPHSPAAPRQWDVELTAQRGVWYMAVQAVGDTAPLAICRAALKAAKEL